MSAAKTTCPVCGAAMPGNWLDYTDYPFCTKRCRTIDLGRWLGEESKVVGGPADDRGRSTPGQDGAERSGD